MQFNFLGLFFRSKYYPKDADEGYGKKFSGHNDASNTLRTLSPENIQRCIAPPPAYVWSALGMSRQCRGHFRTSKPREWPPIAGRDCGASFRDSSFRALDKGYPSSPQITGTRRSTHYNAETVSRNYGNSDGKGQCISRGHWFPRLPARLLT